MNAYHEARGEGKDGILATMHVVRNRLNVRYLGAVNYCDVVVANKQFSWLFDNRSDIPMEWDVYEDIVKMAEQFINSEDSSIDMTKGATHYHADYVNPYWSMRNHNGDLPRGMQLTTKIGKHIFYKFN